MMKKFQQLAAVGLVLALGACASATQTTSLTEAATPATNMERDRQAILAMAGDYKVTFDFRETVALQEKYKLKDAYVTRAEEVVRVIEDRGDFISLQHILLVGGEQKFPIKHWRQDWVFEPESVTRFAGGNVWENVSLDANEAKGKWAQLVYQVDDGPRYAGLAAWSHDNGLSEWASAPSWRPLPRRDATKRTDYHAIEAVNRHAITPNGWVHEQDNTKLVLEGGDARALVREVGVNTYIHTDELNSEVAMDYWNKTKDFWQAIRAEWTRLETETPAFGLTVQGEPEEVYMQILGVATGLVEGELSNEQATKDAIRIIEEYTLLDFKPLATRVAETPEIAPPAAD